MIAKSQIRSGLMLAVSAFVVQMAFAGMSARAEGTPVRVRDTVVTWKVPNWSYIPRMVLTSL